MDAYSTKMLEFGTDTRNMYESVYKPGTHRPMKRRLCDRMVIVKQDKAVACEPMLRFL